MLDTSLQQAVAPQQDDSFDFLSCNAILLYWSLTIDLISSEVFILVDLNLFIIRNITIDLNKFF